MSQFWYPDSIHADNEFQIGYMKHYADKVGIVILPVPPGRHRKNSIESKHHVIRSIYLRLKEASGNGHESKLSSY